MGLIVTQASDPEIAKELAISQHTAGRHVVNIMDKLGVQSRVGIAVWYVRNVEKAA